MKLLFDFFPLILFFLAFKWQGIFVATAVAIGASVLQVVVHWLRLRRFETSHLVTLALITIFGGATLLFQNDTFIKWKPTVLNWLFAVAFLGSQYIGQKNLSERTMGSAITLTQDIWRRINFSWVIFFMVLGCLNIYVIYHYDTDTWVDFKVFGMSALTVIFLFGQMFYLSRHIKEEPQSPS